MTRRETSDRLEDVGNIIAGQGILRTWEKYFHQMTESARRLCQSLGELPLDEISWLETRYYLLKRVAPVAGGGLHTRLARKLSAALREANVEVFSPKKAAEGKGDGFRPLDVPVLLGSAEQGDVVVFRARAKADIMAVAKFFATASVLYELSKGDD